MACFPEFLRNSARNTTGLRLKTPPFFVKKSSIILFILKNFSDFAATIPKTFTARYNPYTQRIELLDTKTQILRNMRGKIIKKYRNFDFFFNILKLFRCGTWNPLADRSNDNFGTMNILDLCLLLLLYVITY